MRIESKENKNIKNLKKLRDKKKDRYESLSFYVEGERIIKNIDASLIKEVYVDENYNGYVPDIDKEKIYEVSSDIFNDIKDTVTTQGIIAIVKMNHIEEGSVSPIVILDNIQDPGNVGTILRTSEAAGVKKVVFINDTSDPYSPKAIRSSMSSITRLDIDIEDDYKKIFEKLKKDGYKIYGTFLEESKSIYDVLYDKNIALVFGNEANGISEDVKKICDEYIHIPMEGNIESLNVSQAVSIVLYELKRRRDS